VANGARQIVVVGAGVSGLTSAALLAEAGWPVRVWAAAMPQRTTSAVAGAVWAPPRPADPADLPKGYGVGFRATLPMIDMPQYLAFLTRRLAAAGCQIEEHPVRSLAEAAETAPIVVNCAGLGAGALTGDDTVRPRFGQHVVLTNPGLRQLFLEIHEDPEWTCYFPHPQRVVCGGISIPGRSDTTPDPEVTERILQRCRRIEPRLGDAAVTETITGLRPDRPSVRLEAEPLGRSRCVHNYGHSGNGVTLSWGCARDVVRLVSGDG
jgi:D-amino-acid oxidase